MKSNKHERDIVISYNNTQNTSIAEILEAIYESVDLLYASGSAADCAVA